MIESSKYDRYFIADKTSPLFKELKRLITVRRESVKILQIFLQDHGIEQMYGNSPLNYLFDLKDLKDYDKKKWRKTPPRRGTYYFAPRKNTEQGRALGAEIAKLPEYPKLDDALATIPDLQLHFCMLEGNRAYSPWIRYFDMKGGKVMVCIPWRDVDKKKLAAYAKQRKGKNPKCFNGSYDHLLWQPPKWLKELKEWEALKLIDEAGSK